MVLLGSLHGWLDRSNAAGALARDVARAVAVAGDGDAGEAAAERLEVAHEDRIGRWGPCPGDEGCFRVSIDQEATSLAAVVTV